MGGFCFGVFVVVNSRRLFAGEVLELFYVSFVLSFLLEALFCWALLCRGVRSLLQSLATLGGGETTYH